MIVSCAALLGFRICLLDITLAYLQAKDKLSREEFIRPKRDHVEFLGIERKKLPRLHNPLYEMCDPGMSYSRKTWNKISLR